MTTFLNQAMQRPWLSALALWTVIGAWAAAGVWGWTQAAAGVMALITILLTIGCQVFAARAAVNAAAASTLSQKIAALALGAMCLLWTGYSGKQAIAVSYATASAPYEAAVAAQAKAAADVAKIEAQIAAIPAVRADIPAVRIAALQAARAEELARLQPQLDAAQAKLAAVVVPAKPAAAMPEALQWAMVVLIEGLEFFGFWAIGAKRATPAPAKPANVVEINPGAALVRKRWEKARAAKVA